MTALALRFVRKLRKRSVEKGPLKSAELNETETWWIHFSDVIKAISNVKSNNLQRQPGVFIDSHGILRSKGRLENAELSESAKFPILLPRNVRLTALITEMVHKQNVHSGVSQTLSQIRRKFRIPHSRTSVRSTLKACGVCRRHEGGNNRMPLPRARV